MITNYRFAKNVRFSCAYLFRIVVNGKYLLVKDEQGRNTFQPVGGVYKYTDSSFFDNTHAIQCTRFGNNSDLDCDLRIIVPRKYLSRFKRWYKKEKGRETPENLYREFREEILDRIDLLNPETFKTIKYKYCGEHIEYSRLGEKDMQIRIADIVEFIPTPEQANALLSLTQHESSLYRFATKEEIYNLGRVNGNQIQTISNHAYKILPEEEKILKRNRRSGKYYSCCDEETNVPAIEESWCGIEKADTTKPFTFISYNSAHSKTVWNFCDVSRPPFENIWIDRKNISENWLDNVEKALKSPECNKAVLFINKEYLIRSTACYQEASMIVNYNIPHIVVLIDVDIQHITQIIKDWIFSDLADKEKLRVFKRLFHYDDDTGHINCSLFPLEKANYPRIFSAYSNL